MRPALLLFNPVTGGGRRRHLVGALRSALARAGWEVEVAPTLGPGTAGEQAAAAARGGAEAVFVLGGDGTLREAAFGLVGTAVPVGFLPGGTANVMTRQLGLPRRPLPAARAMARARVVELDVGLAGDQPFLMQVSAGVDALAIARLDPRWKRLLRQASIVPAGVPAWWTYAYPPIVVEAGGRSLEGSFAVITNIAFYGGPWKIAPGARGDDRRLDLVVFTGAGRRATLGLARDVFLGRHGRRRDVEIVPVTEATLRGPHDLPLQLDGDRLHDRPPLAVRLADRTVRMFAT